MSAQEVKDVETSVAGLRSDKLKEEKATAAGGKKSFKKVALNVGGSGKSAGLDEYVYTDLVDDEYDDFM
jgi:translation initiation factor 3 subunit J